MRTALFLACLFLLLPAQLPAQFQPHVDYATGTYPFSVAVGDFNGDGKLDLAVTNSGDNTVSVLLGKGDGTFQAHVDYATGDINPQWLVAADFNRDGKLDIAIANYGPITRTDRSRSSWATEMAPSSPRRTTPLESILSAS